MASQSQRCIFELGFADAKILHKAIMQATFDHNGSFSGFTKLDHVICFKSFGCTDRQRTTIGQ